jgi:hypothetical protein
MIVRDGNAKVKKKKYFDGKKNKNHQAKLAPACYGWRHQKGS